VKIVSFSATKKSSNIELNWKVENEINIIRYDIEKSTDGRVFKSIGNIASAFNNGQSGYYQFVDSFFNAEVVFYRIKSLDLDGSISFSKIVKISETGSNPNLYVSPNPVENKIINLYFKNQPKGKYVVNILDTKGLQIKSSIYNLIETDKILKIFAEEILHSGAYFLKIDGPNNLKSVIPILIQ
jgi:hypothetical protein